MTRNINKRGKLLILKAGFRQIIAHSTSLNSISGDQVESLWDRINGRLSQELSVKLSISTEFDRDDFFCDVHTRIALVISGFSSYHNRDLGIFVLPYSGSRGFRPTIFGISGFSSYYTWDLGVFVFPYSRSRSFRPTIIGITEFSSYRTRDLGVFLLPYSRSQGFRPTVRIRHWFRFGPPHVTKGNGNL